MDLDYCADCKQPTVAVLDHLTGDSICLDCGLVLESRYIDTTAEWRTFTDSDDKGVDPSRVGAASNPLFDAVCDPAATVISAKNKTSKSSDVLPRRSLATANSADKSLHCALQLLDQMSDGLGLVRAVSDHAKVLFKTAHDHRKPKGKNLYAVVAACLYLACKEKGVPRGIKEIEKVANGSSQKAINKAKNDLVKLMQLGGESTKVIKPADIARRCCSRLWTDNNDMKMSVLETLRNMEEQEIDIRRQPNSVLAAVMYLIVQLYDAKANLSDLSQAAGCEVMTTKRAYKDLYPYASRIVPNKFKFGDLLNKLCAP